MPARSSRRSRSTSSRAPRASSRTSRSTSAAPSTGRHAGRARSGRLARAAAAGAGGAAVGAGEAGPGQGRRQARGRHRRRGAADRRRRSDWSALQQGRPEDVTLGPGGARLGQRQAEPAAQGRRRTMRARPPRARSTRTSPRSRSPGGARQLHRLERLGPAGRAGHRRRGQGGARRGPGGARQPARRQRVRPAGRAERRRHRQRPDRRPRRRPSQNLRAPVAPTCSPPRARHHRQALVNAAQAAIDQANGPPDAQIQAAGGRGAAGRGGVIERRLGNPTKPDPGGARSVPRAPAPVRRLQWQHVSSAQCDCGQNRRGLGDRLGQPAARIGASPAEPAR